MSAPTPLPDVSNEPALTRLNRLAALDEAAQSELNASLRRRRSAQARREVVAEGEVITEPLLILRGWAARVRVLPDGRRQLINFLLPGDLIGLCRHPDPCTASTILAITDVQYCTAPRGAPDAPLGIAYAVSRAIEEAYLLSAITRLGRLNAQERLHDLFLEVLERMQLAGITSDNSIPMPLTQEVLADALGLTSVHVNRMIQLSRRQGHLVLAGGTLTITDPDALGSMIGRSPVRIWGGC
ncbi:Crp/Fnr family transcriptional regulator [Stakelama pacifica]|uniref:CRP-like cAMP-binding protein n=1 Tax=Stakelama pacifica TaxID=517720 RepID=A0A4R6FY08_9SPHN|nr:Crp/Fnr family transcriptional regulator [Stakelama pacifica]TDN86853.1 CRP-like cAMP-binding protein [Stakelama pacifica]